MTLNEPTEFNSAYWASWWPIESCQKWQKHCQNMRRKSKFLSWGNLKNRVISQAFGVVEKTKACQLIWIIKKIVTSQCIAWREAKKPCLQKKSRGLKRWEQCWLDTRTGGVNLDGTSLDLIYLSIFLTRDVCSGCCPSKLTPLKRPNSNFDCIEIPF